MLFVFALFLIQPKCSTHLHLAKLTFSFFVQKKSKKKKKKKAKYSMFLVLNPLQDFECKQIQCHLCHS